MNYAYIDNQNIYMATRTSSHPWEIDMKRFRVYLNEKYHIKRAFLFMGAYNDKYKNRYDQYKNFGYFLVFRPHEGNAIGKKKGNVDTDLVFCCMKDVFTDCNLDKIYLVSGDGDYFRMIDYLNRINKLGKVLLPSHKNASSLYKKLSRECYLYLDNQSLSKKFRK